MAPERPTNMNDLERDLVEGMEQLVSELKSGEPVSLDNAPSELQLQFYDWMLNRRCKDQ